MDVSIFKKCKMILFIEFLFIILNGIFNIFSGKRSIEDSNELHRPLM